MPDNPHEWIAERDFRSDPAAHAAFHEFVAFVRSGGRRSFQGNRYYTNTVCEWTLFLTWGGGHIVNRKPSAQAGWDDEPEQLPLA